MAFGGARGGGKSWAVRAKAKLLALRYPGIRLLLVRRTYQELEANHIRFLRQELAGLAEYRATARQFVFPNGSVLDFGYCAADGDMDRYQGAEYDVIFLDEATQLKEEWLRQFAACLRGVNEFPKRLYYTCNPGGPGHSYIKRLFIDRRFQAGENPDDYVFIPAKVTDNRALLKKQPDYLAAAGGPCPGGCGTRLAGGQVGRVPGAGVPGIYQRPRPLSGPAVHPCHRPLRHPPGVARLPQL
ncbi:MAG: phage terminase large subunit [Oscillospiraceae bacterium]